METDFNTTDIRVVRIDRIRAHRESSKYKVAYVLDCPVVIGWNESFHVGENVVYVPPGVRITNIMLAEYRKSSGIEYTFSNGITMFEVDGVLSHGIILKIPNGKDWELGYIPSEHFMYRRVKDSHKVVLPNTICDEWCNSEDAYLDFPEFRDSKIRGTSFDETTPIVVTERVLGTPIRIGYISGNTMVGTRHFWTLTGDYTKDFLDKTLIKGEAFYVQDCIKTLSHTYSTVVLYGELYGAPCSEYFNYGHYMKGHVKFVACDLLIDYRILSYPIFKSTCKMFGVPTLPELFVGKLNQPVMRAFGGGMTRMGGKHEMAGVLVCKHTDTYVDQKYYVDYRSEKLERILLKRKELL